MVEIVAYYDNLTDLVARFEIYILFSKFELVGDHNRLSVIIASKIVSNILACFETQKIAPINRKYQNIFLISKVLSHFECD